MIDGTGSLLPRSFFDGQISRAQADPARSIVAFNVARDEIGQKLRDDPDNGLLRGILCVINAGLGRKEESLSEGNRAVELPPITKNAVDGAVALTRLAMAYAWLGEKDPAIERLAILPIGRAVPIMANSNLIPPGPRFAGMHVLRRLSTDFSRTRHARNSLILTGRAKSETTSPAVALPLTQKSGESPFLPPLRSREHRN